MRAGTKSRVPSAKFFVTLAVLALFAAFRFWQALLSPQGIWQDSYSYEAVASRLLLSTAFWAGSRPPLAPFLWKLTGTPTSFVASQTALAVIAWGFLAVTVGGLVKSGWRRLLATCAVLAFACTLPVTEWDWSVLSESLALASLVAIFAFSIRYVRTTGLPDAAGLLCAAAAFALARDEDIWTVGLVGIATVVVTLVAWRIASKMNRRRIGKLGVVGVMLLCLALLIEIPAVTSQRDVTNVTDNLAVRIFPYPSRVAWFADRGMPDASEIDRVASASVTVPGTAPVVGIPLQTTEFAPLNQWISADGARIYTLWLLEHPDFLLGDPFVSPTQTFNDANGHIGFYAAPDRLSTAVLDRILFPGLWGELITLAVALALAWRRNAWRREVWVLAVLGALGPVSMLLAWQGDGQEVTRHMVVGSVQTRLAVLLFLLIAALGPSAKKDSPEPQEAQEPDGTPASSAALEALPRVPEPTGAGIHRGIRHTTRGNQIDG